MGAALKYLRKLLEKIGIELDRRTATSLLILLALLILLPIGLFLIRNQLTFLPKAAGELISLGEGGCVKVNKDKKKVVDCPLVPLKLTNPFFNINTVTATPSSSAGTGSAAPSGSAQASPSTSPGTARNVNVKSFNNNIQQALDSIKTTGGSVYLPAGTYPITQKVRLYSNTTLFGDGMGSTIIKFADNVQVDDMVANDSSNGQENITIRDISLSGPGLLNYNSSNCCNGVPYGLKLENLNSAYVINISVDNFPSHGIYIGYKIKEGKPLGVKNARITGCRSTNNGGIGVYLADADNVIVDHCVVQGNGRIQPIDGITLGPDNGASVINSKVLDNNVTGNKGNGIGLASCQEAHKDAPVNGIAVCNNIADPNDFAALRQHKCNAGVFGNIFIGNIDNGEFDNTGGGEILSGPASACDIPGNLSSLPAVPPKPVADNSSWINKIIDTVSAQDSDDVFLDAEDSDSSDQFINDGTSNSDDDFGAGNLGTGNPGSDKLLYRLSESQAGLNQAKWKEFALVNQKNWLASFIDSLFSPVFAQSSTPSASTGPVSSGTPSFSIGSQFINTTFQLTDIKPGTKQVWVQFLHPDGTIRVDSFTFDLVEKTPQISGLACNLDISKENLKITIEGEHFGNAVGTVESVTPALKPEVLGWNDKQIIAFLKKPNIPINEGQRFKIKLTRPDGFESGTAVCAVDKSLVSLGARIFCREPGKFDAQNVAVILLFNPNDPASPNKINKVEEKVTINADGEIANLKTKLQVDKNYAIAIKAPSSIRRTAVFTAQEGTTEILRPDGSPFILPIGDIAPPVSPDGRINTLDRSELIRQWRILGQGDSKLTGDFNRDSRVNSIDWACMNYDFGAEDDPIPVSVPQPASGTLHIPGGEATITIPSSSASPSPNGSASPVPSPSKDTSNSAKIDLGGKLFLDTNRNQIADIGESFISQGSAVVKLLQVPEEHIVGTPLTAQELADSKILSQVTNNLPGANYDISVFVDKDSGTKFSVLATANNGELTGKIDFALTSPLTDSNQVINIPVTSPTQ